jgi:hypothetical protein
MAHCETISKPRSAARRWVCAARGHWISHNLVRITMADFPPHRSASVDPAAQPDIDRINIYYNFSVSCFLAARSLNARSSRPMPGEVDELSDAVTARRFRRRASLLSPGVDPPTCRSPKQRNSGDGRRYAGAPPAFPLKAPITPTACSSTSLSGSKARQRHWTSKRPITWKDDALGAMNGRRSRQSKQAQAGRGGGRPD